MTLSLPGSSTKRAPGTWSRTYSAWRRSTRWSPSRRMTSVGTRISGRMSRTSVSPITRIAGSTAAGPTASRSMRPNQSRRAASPECSGAAASTRHALSPALDAALDERLAPHGVVRPRVVGRGEDARDRREQRERAHALRVRGREQAGERRALRLGEYRRALAAGGVEHREHVLHLLLERRRRDAVGHAAAAAVELDQAREGGQAREHPRQPRLGPQVLHLRHPGVDEQHVVRPVAGDLVGERDAAVAGVAGARSPRDPVAREQVTARLRAATAGRGSSGGPL